MLQNNRDISINELIINESLSTRAVNICVFSKLTTLSKILKYYEVHGSFRNIRNCGSNTDKELRDLCNKYKDYFSNIKDIPGGAANDARLSRNLSLQELSILEELSKTTVRICSQYGLTSLFEILEFYKIGGTFINYIKHGDVIERELVEICRKYQMPVSEVYSNDNTNSEIIEEDIANTQTDIKSNASPEINNNDLLMKENFELDKLNSLSTFQKATLDKYLLYQVSNLNVRTSNGLKQISKTINPNEIYETIFQSGFNFKNIRNIGSYSLKEFEVFKNNLRSYIEVLQSLEIKDLKKEYLRYFILTTFFGLPENFEEKLETMFDEKYKIRVFYLLKCLLESYLFFTKCEKSIFDFSFLHRNNESFTLVSVANEQNITRERARQIKVKLEKHIQDYFLFLSQFPNDELVDYGIDGFNLHYIIDYSFIKDINEREKVDFNKTFYAIIFSILLQGTHFVLGDDEVIYGKRNTPNQKKYRNCYLIKYDLKDIFDFNGFMEDMFIKKNSRITQTYHLDLKRHIVLFFKSGIKENLYKVLSICESLILNELDLVLNTNGQIIFERNIRKSLPEYCTEVLEAKSDPMTLEQIKTVIQEKYPNIDLNTTSLRACLVNPKNEFIHFGRSSTYGLRKWETERADIKGGTIRDIVEDYLKIENTPKHISEILNYLLKYRPGANIENIKSNLILEKNNRFRFFSGGFVGLKSIQYPEDTVKLKRIIGTHFRSSEFKKMMGWHFDDIVKYFVNNYDYSAISITYLLKKKIADGKLNFSPDNRLLKMEVAISDSDGDSEDNPFTRSNWIKQRFPLTAKRQEQLLALFGKDVKSILEIRPENYGRYVAFVAIRWGFATIVDNKLTQTEKWNRRNNYDNYGQIIKIHNESQVQRIKIKPKSVFVNVEDMVAMLKSSENYASLKNILALKNDNEEKAKKILIENLGNLNYEHLREILTLIDEPYPYSNMGKINKGPWFGRLLKLNASNVFEEDLVKINHWYNTLVDNNFQVEEKLELLLDGPNSIKGLNVGFITLMLYILDKENYLIWFQGQHEGLSFIYPNLEEYTGKASQYTTFNILAKKFAKQYGFEHSELDWVFSTGIYLTSSKTIYEQIKDILNGEIGNIVDSSQVKKLLGLKYGTNASSIILSDYCYNRINIGIKFNKHLFEYIDRDSYTYLGENYPYTGLIYAKPFGSEKELVAGEWKNGIKMLYDNPNPWIGLEQLNYTVEQIFEKQNTDPFVRKILLAFHIELTHSLDIKSLDWFARTHKTGITYLCNARKAFIFINVFQEFITIKFFTGKSEIDGLKKGTWINKDDNLSNEPFRIVDNSLINQAVHFASMAYKIALEWEGEL